MPDPQLTLVRRVMKTSAGGEIHFDGANLHVSEPNSATPDEGPAAMLELSPGDVQNLIWVLTGRHSRAGRAKPKN